MGIGNRIGKYVLSAAIFLLLVLLWQLLVSELHTPSYLLPKPSEIIATIVQSKIPWGEHVLVTSYESLAGFGLAAFVGIPVASFMALWKRISQVTYPLVVVAQLMPKLAFVPILFIWLGFNDLPRIVTVFLVCFFPIVIDTMVGLSSVDQDMVYLFRTFSQSRLDLFRKVMFPTALPNIFAGLKVSITLALIGAIVAEFVSSSQGLGFLILSAQVQFNTTLALAAASLLILIGMIFYAALELIERFSVPWRSGHDSFDAGLRQTTGN